jgi:hypothetical protein
MSSTQISVATACAYASLKKLPHFDGISSVEMPEDWRRCGPTTYTFVFTSDELTEEQTRAYHRAMGALNEINPRVFTPGATALASLFHPSFWAAVRHSHISQHTPSILNRCRLLFSPKCQVDLPRYYLQSLLFLTGVTLSAAVVQSRWSRGTIESKLSRLWQAAAAAAAAPGADLASLDALKLADAVNALAPRLDNPDVHMLIELKEIFATSLGAIMDDTTEEIVTLTAPKLSNAQRDRFGFVSHLQATLGSNLKAIVVYGSSLTSNAFADYDLLLITSNPHKALTQLAGTCPSYRGIELNVGIYGLADFWTYQLASGDNLTDNALCLFGEVAVPKKPVYSLLARNYSFGFIRLRQLLGMATFASSQPTCGDNKQNLYGYFVKIPLNIAKGTRAAVGASVDKETIRAWVQQKVDYDVSSMLSLCAHNQFGEAIASSAWCTQRVLEHLNEDHPAFETTSAIEGTG